MNRRTCARACSPTRITSLVASCNGMSEMKSPLPVSPSRPSRNGEPTNRIVSDSGQNTICPLSSSPWNQTKNAGFLRQMESQAFYIKLLMRISKKKNHIRCCALNTKGLVLSVLNKIFNMKVFGKKFDI